jgi:hypothetical protein
MAMKLVIPLATSYFDIYTHFKAMTAKQAKVIAGLSSAVYFMAHGQSTSSSGYQGPLWGPMTRFYLNPFFRDNYFVVDGSVSRSSLVIMALPFISSMKGPLIKH